MRAIKFFWEPMPWERTHRAGERFVTWPEVPRVGDLVNLILQNKEDLGGGPTVVTFCAARVLWNPDGLDGSRVHIYLESTGVTRGA